MHPDHAGGLMAEGKLVFPNAVLRANKREADFWLNEANLEKSPAAMKDFFKGAMASVNPYIAAGKFKPFDGDTQLVPGIEVIPAPGHTPGHSIYSIESQGQKMVLWGDLVPKRSDATPARLRRRREGGISRRHGTPGVSRHRSCTCRR
jgi:glyoxylase-like metal-dependent hydrolase (beta-lactamase superfamily II)